MIRVQLSIRRIQSVHSDRIPKYRAVKADDHNTDRFPGGVSGAMSKALLLILGGTICGAMMSQ